jgi:hypothetical protein
MNNVTTWPGATVIAGSVYPAPTSVGLWPKTVEAVKATKPRKINRDRIDAPVWNITESSIIVCLNRPQRLKDLKPQSAAAAQAKERFNNRKPYN